MEATLTAITYQERLEALRAAKLQQTLEKQRVVGAMDHDDHALILPPPDQRKLVEAISSSGMPITDCLLSSFEVIPNHPSGGFFGPRAVRRRISAGCCAATRSISTRPARWPAATW